jgi:hypothetical protein
LTSVTSVTHFWVWGVRFELAFQQVLGHDALFASVGLVSLPASDLADQPQVAHQLQHGLFGDRPPLLQQFGMDPAVPVPAVVLLEICVIAAFRDARASGPLSLAWW